jgi:hypothetical protein
MMADFAHPKSPSVISYLSVDKQWSQWGYTVSMNRTAPQEFSSLSDGTARGFSFSGSGTATVTTPAQYQPGSEVEVTVSGPAGSTMEMTRVLPDGRVAIVVPLASGGQARVGIDDHR